MITTQAKLINTPLTHSTAATRSVYLKRGAPDHTSAAGLDTPATAGRGGGGVTSHPWALTFTQQHRLSVVKRLFALAVAG